MKRTILILFILSFVYYSLAFVSAGEIIELDFSSADQAEYFTTIEEGTGNWEVKDGALHFTQQRGDPGLSESWWNIIALTASSYKDFILEFDLYLDDNEYLMVTFGSENPLLRHESQYSYGVIFWNYHTTGGKKAAEFIKTTPDEPGYPVLGISRQTVSAFEVNKIKMVKNGSTFELYLKTDDPDLTNEGLDGETELLNLEEPITDLEGYIQLFSGNGRCRIENFTIRPFSFESSTESGQPTDSESESNQVTLTPTQSSGEMTDDTKTSDFPFIYLGLGVVVIAIVVLVAVKSKNK